jgi:hypothetical protein
MESQSIGSLSFCFKLLVECPIDGENERCANTASYGEDSIILFGEIREAAGGAIRAFDFD